MDSSNTGRRYRVIITLVLIVLALALIVIIMIAGHHPDPTQSLINCVNNAIAAGTDPSACPSG